MTLTTAQAFASFQESLTATAYQTGTLIPARRRGVEERLSGAFPSSSDLPFSECKMMGSAAKGTIIRPFDDVDVLAVFSNVKNAWNTYQWDSQSFIYRIRAAYSGLSVQQVGTRGQAVRVFYEGGGHVDIAPVFEVGGGVYKLPAGDGTWISTAPFVASNWYADRHRDLGYQLSPVIRLLKAWNRAHSRRLRSFHLETVAATVFGQLGTDHRVAVLRFFEWSQTRLAVADPGGQSGNLSGYLSWTAHQDVVQALESARVRAANAIAAEQRADHAEAKRQWAVVFGPDFPTS
ncbi:MULTISPECIES: SMODS domain-containing nucleotidyltransferase [unclassified Microbacterium]|uniref:SMODS domain-containing nucleotidyltransferase n=1 Tax=unclassified Microbacterium TaxID=2609290 RepID=UPI0006CF9C9E|nr:nucleotidyltransferase [Microbacterium sp. No. 7]